MDAVAESNDSTVPPMDHAYLLKHQSLWDVCSLKKDSDMQKWTYMYAALPASAPSNDAELLKQREDIPLT